MRNLKKLLAVLVVVAVMATMFAVPVFAEETTISADAKTCADLGMLEGRGAGVTPEYTAEPVDRLQGALLYLRLKGLGDAAEAYTGTKNFADAKTSNWGQKVMAYLKDHPELGMVGDPAKNLFMPTDKMTAQQYYKIMLVALGYVEDVDFKFADTMSFAADKGLVKNADVKSFTIDDLAVATVEALKAPVKGGTKTLAETMVEAGTLDAAKAEAAGLYSTAATAKVDVTGVKTVKVTFNKAVDTTKAVFTVTLNNVAVAATAAWNTEKTVATLTSTDKLVVGTYSLKIAGVGLATETSTFDVKAEALTSIKLTNATVKPGVANAAIGFKGYNQYTEEMTVSGANFIWTAYDRTAKMNLTTTPTAGGCTIPTNGAGVKAGDEVLVTVVNAANSSISLSTAIIISDSAMGQITLSNLVLPTGETMLMQKSTATYYEVPYTLSDLAGNVVTLDDTLETALPTTISGIVFSTDKPAIFTHVKVESGKLYVKIAANQSGDAKLVATVIASGKVAPLQVTVNKLSDTDAMVIGTQPAQLTAGGATIKVPVSVYDQYGKLLTAAEFATAGVADFSVGTTNPAIATATINADGKTLDIIPVGEGTATITITNSNSSKVITYTAVVKAAAVPTTFNYTVDNTTLVKNATAVIKAKVYNQYGEEMAAAALAAYQFIVTQPATGDVTVAGSPATVTSNNMINTGVTVTAVNPNTTSKVTVRFELTAGNVEVVTREVAFNVVNTTSALTYTLGTISTVYAAVPAGTANYAAAAVLDANGAVAGNTADKYKGTVTVVAKDATGTTVAIPTAYITGVQFVGANAGLVLQNGANGVDFIVKAWADTDVTKDIDYIVTVKNPDNTLTVLNGKFTASKAALQATAIKLMSNVGANTVYTDDTEITDATIELTPAAINGMNGQKLIENQAGSATLPIYFQVVDQYGVTSLNPLVFISAVVLDASGAGCDFSVAADGTVTATAVAAGDKLQIQALDALGHTKLITIVAR